MAEDRPITGGGDLTTIRIGLPRLTQPVAGDFSVTVVDQQKPYTRIVFTGLDKEEIIPGDEPGSLVWPLKSGFSMTME